VTLVDVLKARDAGLAKVLARCSYLRDGVAVRDMATGLASAQTIDVLPPFAGG
jgi:sulfur-carrier protein